MDDVEVEPEVWWQLFSFPLLPSGGPHSKLAPTGGTPAALTTTTTTAAAAAAVGCTPAVPLTGATASATAATGDGPLHALDLKDAGHKGTDTQADLRGGEKREGEEGGGWEGEMVTSEMEGDTCENVCSSTPHG